MRLLDLYCGAGGAAMGYHRAGFEVVGIDKAQQPNYPFEFIQMNALKLLDLDLDGYDVIHASPPCQHSTAYRRRPDHVKSVPNLINPTRTLLQRSGKHYVIENVEPARKFLRDPVRLCGSSFGLDVRRHRLFESSIGLTDVPQCSHAWQTPRFPQATNRINLRSTVEIGVWRIPLAVQQMAMGGVDWMTLEELSESIPPTYTEWIGKQLMKGLEDGS